MSWISILDKNKQPFEKSLNKEIIEKINDKPIINDIKNPEDEFEILYTSNMSDIKIDFENLRLMFPLVKNNYILQILYDLIVDKERIYSVFSLPFSFGALMCFYSLEKTFIVSVPATAFIVLVLNKMVNKPVVFNASRRNAPRL